MALDLIMGDLVYPRTNNLNNFLDYGLCSVSEDFRGKVKYIENGILYGYVITKKGKKKNINWTPVATKCDNSDLTFKTSLKKKYNLKPINIDDYILYYID